jgi:hypothetical protein
MMNGLEKSDSAIRAKKPANKAGQPAAEWVEQRAGTKGNTGQPRTCRAQHRGGVSQGLERVRKAARQRKKEKFTALLGCLRQDSEPSTNRFSLKPPDEVKFSQATRNSSRCTARRNPMGFHRKQCVVLSH